MTKSIRSLFIQTLPKMPRKDQKLLKGLLDEAHPFTFEEGLQLHDLTIYRNEMFLPAPKCWIEFHLNQYIETGEDPRLRTTFAIHLEGHKEIPYEARMAIRQVADISIFGWNWGKGSPVQLLGTGVLMISRDGDTEIKWEGEVSEEFLIFLRTVLHHINHPSYYRTVKEVHKGQNRQAIRSGLYPLKATTVVSISRRTMTKRVSSSGIGSPKCHHFVRSHIRTYRRNTLDQFEVHVPAHWRGDPRYGVKNTEYKVEQ